VVAALAALAIAFPHGTAVISTGHGTVHLRVEIAETQRAWSAGLMNRHMLGRRAGMAFVFPTETRGAFWMKDTLIPLSIAFYGAGGRILRMLDMKPCGTGHCPLYDPHVAYRGALEVNRGAYRRWRVRVGDRIELYRDY
jgi:uncharacterized protein